MTNTRIQEKTPVKRDYQREMETLVEALSGSRPGLLLHACCAPCASAVLERLFPHFSLTLYYYNPNIQPLQEYRKRFAEFPRLLRLNGMEGQVALLEGTYDEDAFRAASAGLEGEPEGGARCPRCFALRLEETAKKAVALGIPYFATTLTVSPHKNAPVINAIGEMLAERYGLRWLPSDFKKKDGYLRSIRLSAAYGLYRQSTCGCLFGQKKSGKGDPFPVRI